MDVRHVNLETGKPRPREWCSRRSLCCAAGVLVVVVVLALIPVYKDADSSSSSTSADALPLVAPPVRAAAPASLKAAASAKRSLQAVSAQAVLDRFFSEGPTNMFTILENVDGRIEGINMRIAQFPCLTNGTTRVNFTLDGWGDTPQPLFSAQCADRLNNVSFVLFGRDGNTTYLYERSTETMVAAIVVRDGNTTTRVEAWYSVGLSNLNGSHAVVHILAAPTADPPVFEMAAAGNGIGFCGAQLRSDNRNVYLIGSEDMGTTCAATDTSCSSALDVNTTLTNCTSAVTAMVLSPLGRQAYVGPSGTTLAASAFPGGADNTVMLRANGTDMTLFGPLLVPDGL